MEESKNNVEIQNEALKEFLLEGEKRMFDRTKKAIEEILNEIDDPRGKNTAEILFNILTNKLIIDRLDELIESGLEK